MIDERSWPVVTHARGRVLNDLGNHAAVRVAFCYDPSDPYAVTICLNTEARPKSSIAWILSRDLLSDGLKWRVGTGDVLVEPLSGNSTQLVHLTLRNERDHAVVELREKDVAAFLRNSYAVVGRGQEYRYLDIDSVLLQLLTD